MEEDSICLLDREGVKWRGPVFIPFLQTVTPAFKARAEEIRLSATWKEEAFTKICVEFDKDGNTKSLPLAPEFHPTITASRIRIMAGMSIVPSEEQTGMMRMRFNEEVINVSVRILREINILKQDGHETIYLNLDWN
jgi:hypothetical protein